MNIGITLLAWLICGITIVACLMGSGIVSIDIDVDLPFDDKDDQKSDTEESKKP